MNELKNQKPFSLKARSLSFKYAFRGIVEVLRSQHNAWIHLIAACLVVFAGFWFNVSQSEWIAIIISIGMVFSAEAFNTAIELLVDKISPHYDEVAGKVKDVAAGAVLFAAIAAATVGIIIFVPKLMDFLP